MPDSCPSWPKVPAVGEEPVAKTCRRLLAVMHRHLRIRPSAPLDRQSEIADLRAEPGRPNVAESADHDFLGTAQPGRMAQRVKPVDEMRAVLSIGAYRAAGRRQDNEALFRQRAQFERSIRHTDQAPPISGLAGPLLNATNPDCAIRAIRSAGPGCEMRC